MAVILGLLLGTTGILCITGAIAFWRNGVTRGPGGIWETAGVFSYLLHVIFGLLMLSAIAPTSMAEERQRGSLDLLAATTLSTRAIVLGKWLGTYRLAVLLIVGPGLAALAMATAREVSPWIPPPGLHPDYHRVIPLGPRIAGVFVVIGTILAHGALLTSIGLALAVWIKRQSRAIASSVGLFVLIAAVWPIFASIAMFRVTGGADLAALSPVAACTNILSYFTMRRYAFAPGILWSGSFWAVEVLILALGLLWLTVGTFDRCCDRIPDSASRSTVPARCVIILAALIWAVSMVGAIAVWVEGIVPHDSETATVVGVLAYNVVLAIGLALVMVVSATSMSPERQWEASSPAAASVPAATAPRVFLDRWWKSFRLVLLLALGPAFIAPDLATTHKVIPLVAKVTNSPSGTPVLTWEPPDPVTANAERYGAVRLAQRLAAAALWIGTILAHGAAAVSLGLALGTAFPHRRRAIIASIAVVVMILVPLPLYSFVNFVIGNPALDPGAASWNFLAAAGSLLAPLFTRTESNIREVLAAAMLWDTVITLFAAGLLLGTIGMARRLSLGLSPAAPVTRGLESRLQPARHADPESA
jgi:hypothetical protein